MTAIVHYEDEFARKGVHLSHAQLVKWGHDAVKGRASKADPETNLSRPCSWQTAELNPGRRLVTVSND